MIIIFNAISNDLRLFWGIRFPNETENLSEKDRSVNSKFLKFNLQQYICKLICSMDKAIRGKREKNNI